MSISVAIVIPAYREGSYIEKTLHSIEKSVQYSIEKNWIPNVIVVVNNPLNVSDAFRLDNRQLIRALSSLQPEFSFPLDVLDYTEPGLKNGVGEARKIGMDFASSKYLKNPQDLIVSLDADCTVELNYIATLFDLRLQGSAFALYFEHAIDSDPILFYELYLRYLRWGHLLAESPFSHYSVGSCLGTTHANYQRSGGMTPKSATEDFHFLNKLRKLGPIQYLTDTVVYPSSRLSQRVTLGTGYFLTAAKSDFEKTFEKLMLPAPEDFRSLGKAISLITHYVGESTLGKLFDEARIGDIYADLHARGIIEKIFGIFESTTQENIYRSRLLEVFDGLETLRILRFLWMKRSAPVSKKVFLDWVNEVCSTDISGPKDLLFEIRKKERATSSVF